MKKVYLIAFLAITMAAQAAEQITIAEFINRADESTTYRVRGEVRNISSTYYGNYDLKDETGSIYVFGTLNTNGQTGKFSTLGVEEGDTITLEGTYTLYGSKHEIVNARYISHVRPAVAWEPIPATISEFIELNDGKRYILTGVVSNITNTTYGNLTLTDETGSIIVWGLKQKGDGSNFAFSTSGIAEEDTLTISGIYQYYNNTTPEVTSGRYLSHKKPDVPVTPAALRVCAQNLENYYFNYDATETTRPSYHNAAGFRAKTMKIVNSMLTIDADIYAFCEVEAKPIVLAQLADSMNAHAGIAGRYAAVSDNIDYTWYEGIPDNQIKSGFIYRTDKVATLGINTSAVNGNGYYARTMRIQAFKLLANNEALVLSMNHFKAKDSSADQGEGMRQINANNLVSALDYVSEDPDVLVLGDLNCEYGETPIRIIRNAGFEEQILRFDSSAYSHCYNGGELIDHVMANASMSAQITNAYVSHVCTWKCTDGVYSSNSYSDHDPYVIEIILGKKIATDVETSDAMPLPPQAQKEIRHGQLIIIRGGVEYTITGQRLY